MPVSSRTHRSARSRTRSSPSTRLGQLKVADSVVPPGASTATAFTSITRGSGIRGSRRSATTPSSVTGDQSSSGAAPNRPR